MGKPGGSNVPSPLREWILQTERTRGSETSQYPEEKKSNETPKVAASEMGRGQTMVIRHRGVIGPAGSRRSNQEKPAGKPCQRG